MVDKRLNEQFLEKYSNYDFAKIKEEKIFLVGSITKAKVEFYEIESILQIIHQKLVSICSVDGLLNKMKFSEDEWVKLQNIALRKLKQQDAILVLDIDGYIGVQSREEINLFKDKLKKPVYFLSDL
ncbi:MAG: hypothetical protein GF317_19645 [Candidatus Lokiarchaeota archaeon]|nr:hypothetical protein [Candidatus Lokiarchaeota archaeon]MBD3201711.1 hypothetical protein [Candidatus Lokiarchaeota archaeon]